VAVDQEAALGTDLDREDPARQLGGEGDYGLSVLAP